MGAIGERRRVNFYTDGACIRNGKPDGGQMGAGIICYEGDERREWSVALGKGTNQRAELMAVREALLSVEQPSTAHVTIYTDSRYAIGCLAWGWNAKTNLDVIVPTIALTREFASFRMQFVKGHAGNQQNERADVLATQAARGEQLDPCRS